MKHICSLLIFSLFFHAFEAGTSYWTETFQYTDSECTVPNGYVIRTTQSGCTDVTACTPTGHGYFYKFTCTDKASGPNPAESLPEEARTGGWATLKTYTTSDCTNEMLIENYYFGPAGQCIRIWEPYFFSLLTDCNPDNPANSTIYVGPCDEDIVVAVVSTTALNTCTENESGSGIATCNPPAPPVDAPVAAPGDVNTPATAPQATTAPGTTPQSAPVPSTGPSGPPTAVPLLAPFTSNTPVRTSNAVSVACGTIFFAVISLAAHTCF